MFYEHKALKKKIKKNKKKPGQLENRWRVIGGYKSMFHSLMFKDGLARLQHHSTTT